MTVLIRKIVFAIEVTIDDFWLPLLHVSCSHHVATMRLRGLTGDG